MFIQVIQGRAKDADRLHRQLDRWNEELAGGAAGFLGSTAGVAEDGTAIVVARFQDEAAAKANSDRPEQGDWWAETAACFDGDVTFRDSTDVDTSMAGGSDAAGFVQVMQGRAEDRDRLRATEGEVLPRLQQLRPDLIGSVRAWDGDAFTEVIYFTSEADAREGEAAMGEQLGAELQAYSELADDLTYLDLKDPWLYSP